MAIAVDELLGLEMQKGQKSLMVLWHTSQKLPMWAPLEQSQPGALIRTGWETGLFSQQVRMGFAGVFGFMTCKDVEFLPVKQKGETY